MNVVAPLFERSLGNNPLAWQCSLNLVGSIPEANSKVQGIALDLISLAALAFIVMSYDSIYTSELYKLEGGFAGLGD